MRLLDLESDLRRAIKKDDFEAHFQPIVRLSDGAVVNFSGMTHRRIYWKIGVEYRTTVDQLRQVRDGINYVPALPV